MSGDDPFAVIEAEIAALEEGGYYTPQQLEEDKTWYPKYAYGQLYAALREANRRRRRVAELRQQLMAMAWQAEYDAKAKDWFDRLSALKLEEAEMVAWEPDTEEGVAEKQFSLAIIRAEIADLEKASYHVKS